MEKTIIQEHHDNITAVEKAVSDYLGKAYKSDYEINPDEYMKMIDIYQMIGNAFDSWYRIKKD